MFAVRRGSTLLHQVGRRIGAETRALPMICPLNGHILSSFSCSAKSGESQPGEIKVGKAKAVPTTYREMELDCLVTLACMGNFDAREEMVKRHIMQTDDVSYTIACQLFCEIEEKNYEFMKLLAFPFQVGIVSAFSAALFSIPLVFHLPTVEYFNEHFVTADVPPAKDLETALEVGSWSWNWMEPALGTSTFILLCLQYMRFHLNQLGVKPYTHQMKKIRARRLVRAFPQYSEDLLHAYSLASPFYDSKKLWI